MLSPWHKREGQGSWPLWPSPPAKECSGLCIGLRASRVPVLTSVRLTLGERGGLSGSLHGSIDPSPMKLRDKDLVHPAPGSWLCPCGSLCPLTLAAETASDFLSGHCLLREPLRTLQTDPGEMPSREEQPGARGEFQVLFVCLLQKSPAVKVTYFKGCMGEAFLNGHSVGLWNYVEREGRCRGCFGR